MQCFRKGCQPRIESSIFHVNKSHQICSFKFHEINKLRNRISYFVHCIDHLILLFLLLFLFPRTIINLITALKRSCSPEALQIGGTLHSVTTLLLYIFLTSGIAVIFWGNNYLRELT